MRERLDALLVDTGEGTGFARLAADPGRVGLESLLAEIGKLDLLRSLALPPDLLRGIHPDQLNHCDAPQRVPRRLLPFGSCSMSRHSPDARSDGRHGPPVVTCLAIQFESKRPARPIPR